MTNPTIASAPRAAGAMKTIPSLRVRIARAHLLAVLLHPARSSHRCLLAVWALCRAAALGDRIGERLHDARGREEDARGAGRRSSGRGSCRTSG